MTFDKASSETYTVKINDLWYAFGYDSEKNEIFTIGTDCPRVSHGVGRWYAPCKKSFVLNMVKPCKSSANAVNKAKRGGIYCGVFDASKFAS